jgi:AraC family 4-hydroxyphenylacetate 3-monooxygenase operon regulatory protein
MRKRELKRLQNGEIFQTSYVPGDLQLVLDLQKMIDIHFKEERGARFYCEQLKVSVRRLNGHCMAYLDKTINVMIKERVLKEAKNLLKYSRLNSKQISFDIGFTDPAYFSRFFLREIGTRPNDYRKQFKKKKKK